MGKLCMESEYPNVPPLCQNQECRTEVQNEARWNPCSNACPMHIYASSFKYVSEPW